MVTILASIHSAKTKSKVLVRPGKSCLGPSFSWDTVIHNTTPPGSGCSTSDSAFPGRKPRKVGIFSQARKSFSSFTQDLSAETGAGSSFQQMMQLLQHQGWPFIQNSCSLSTAQMATLVTKQDRFIKKSPIFPTAQVHLWGKSPLHAAATGTISSLGTGSSRVLSSGTASAGTYSCCCWSCQRPACCPLGLQFSGSCELRRRVHRRTSNQERRGHNSDSSFLS